MLERFLTDRIFGVLIMAGLTAQAFALAPPAGAVLNTPDCDNSGRSSLCSWPGQSSTSPGGGQDMLQQQLTQGPGPNPFGAGVLQQLPN